MIQEESGESSQSPLEFKDRMVDMSGLQLLRAPADCLEMIFKVTRHPELLWLRCEIYPYLSLPSWIQEYSSESCLPSWIPIKNLRVLELVKLQGWWPRGGERPVLGTLWNTEYEAPLQLRELKISCGLLELPKSIGQLKYLQKIALHDFRGTLPEEFFHICSLKHLRLRALLLESLPDSLENFTNLQHIDLSLCTELQTLPASIGNLKHVQYINLTRCVNLQWLPQSFGDLTNLQNVILQHCVKLKMLPDSMNLIRLKHLDLSRCRDLILTCQTLENVSTLERLDFSGCRKMEILPSQVTRQQFLEELILEDTNLKELPNAIGDLSNLENLAISSPSLETVPHSLSKLRKLKRLRLCSGKLKYFTDLVGELKPLASLLINSPYGEVPFASVEKVQGGRTLMDPSIDKCRLRLKSLDLSKTRITEITFGEGVCPDLEYLDLADCDKLVEVGALPTTLTVLRLSNCRSLKRVRCLRGLAKLRSLEMKGCKEIENLPDVRELDNLINLYLEECPMGGVMPFASIEKVQGGRRLDSSSIGKCMPILRRLHLSKTRITEISFGGGVCPVLEHLHLSGCDDLVEIGALPTTLRSLELQDCCALKKITGLPSLLAQLEYLDTSGCKGIEQLTDLRVKELDNLRELNLGECPIGGVLPFASVENVQGGCRLLYSSIDKCMPRLERLSLSKTRITEITFGEGVCPVLQSLHLSGCGDLVEIGALPTTLTSLELQDCCALKKIGGLRGLAKLEGLNMRGCCAVEELPGLETLISLFEMRTSECENMKRILELAEAANPESDVLKNVIQLIQSYWRMAEGSENMRRILMLTETAYPESDVIELLDLMRPKEA